MSKAPIPFGILLLLLAATSTVHVRAEPVDIFLNFDFARVEQLLSALTLEQKIGQMMQIHISNILHPDTLEVDMDRLQHFTDLGVGSFYGSPFADGPHNGKAGWTAKEWRGIIETIQNASSVPVFFGIESGHGAHFVQEATLFPHQIGVAATFNNHIVYQSGRVVAHDTLAAGIPVVIGPVLGIASKKAWPGVFETFGEDPYHVTQMGPLLARAFDESGCGLCIKDYIGRSAPTAGKDGANSEIPDVDLWNYHYPAYKAVLWPVRCIIGSSSTVNGEPVVSSKKYVQDLLRSRGGYNGIFLAGPDGIANMVDVHGVTTSLTEATYQAVNASVDMSGDENFLSNMLTLVQLGRISEERINESVERILYFKNDVGLLVEPVPGTEYVDSVGSADDVNLALTVTRESIVLLKNEGETLPLPTNDSVLLTGPSISSIGALCGGNTFHEQGASETEFHRGQSIEQALGGAISKLQSIPVVSFSGCVDEDERARALDAAKTSNFTIVTLGEAPYSGKLGDIDDYSLAEGQLQWVRDLKKTGTKIVLVLVMGRPRLLNGVVELADAVIHAWLPCEQGGRAIMEVLTGKVNPSGRLPITYPKHSANFDIPYYSRANVQCQGKDGAVVPCEMEWEFGHGLSYTTFEYSDMQVTYPFTAAPNRVSLWEVPDDVELISVIVNVTNTGSIAGHETVLLFMTQRTRAGNAPERKLLKGYQKFFFAPGESKLVEFIIDRQDWGAQGPNLNELITDQIGRVFITLKPETICDTKANAGRVDDLLCKSIDYHSLVNTTLSAVNDTDTDTDTDSMEDD